MRIKHRSQLFRMYSLFLLLGTQFSAVLACSTETGSLSSGSTGGADSGATGGLPSCLNEQLGELLTYDCDRLQSQNLYVKKACGGTAIAWFQTDAYTNRVFDDASGEAVFVESGGVTTAPCQSGEQICEELDFVVGGDDFVPLAESILCLGQGGMGGSR